ncbi:unnamed protein product [Medioppia subpectinata]|uniref:RING-type domain-containing protein n=1 Tax=Medioppia subpectinata TaxID=1979941 RepID=A0A7R9L1A7_9ACAR|nr:unnamed protein product [Medioppia subpectinata]CAG2113488.1 unnamed protein product [Medioppia subpectinata]
MPGYSRDRFVDLSDRESDELMCGICLQILRSPVVTPCCRHAYCRACMGQWLAVNSSCPNDRQPLIASELQYPQRLACNLLARLRIGCQFSAYGCPHVLELQCLARHEDCCRFNSDRRCADCGQKVGVSTEGSTTCDRLDGPVVGPPLLLEPQQLPLQPVAHNCVLSLKQLNESLAEEVSQLKCEILKLKDRIKTLTDCRDNYALPPDDTQSDHINQVLASARQRLRHPEITYCSLASGLRAKAVDTCREAITTYDTYGEIAAFMSRQFNDCHTSSAADNGPNKWYTMAQAVRCGAALITSDRGWIDMRFGQLRIAVFCVAGVGAPLQPV